MLPPRPVAFCGIARPQSFLLQLRAAGIDPIAEAFFRDHHAWLTKILQRGVTRGEFKLAVPAANMARFVFGALQGALLVKRTTGDAGALKEAVAVLKAQILMQKRLTQKRLTK